MVMKVRVGDYLVFSTHDFEVYSGEVHSVSQTNMQVWKLFRHDALSEVEGLLTFYAEELRQVIRIGAITKPEQNGISGDEQMLIDADCKMSFEEYNNLNQIVWKCQYISIKNEDFTKAIDTLWQSEVIGVAGVGNTFNKQEPLSLLVCSTTKKVFIFDVACIREDISALKEILESRLSRKIVSQGAALYECLFKQYNIELANLLDLQMSDLLLREKHTKVLQQKTKNIQELLDYYFHFPTCLLDGAIASLGGENWTNKRPLNKIMLVKAAQLAVYLPVLYKHIAGLLVVDHNNMVARYYNNAADIRD